MRIYYGIRFYAYVSANKLLLSLIMGRKKNANFSQQHLEATLLWKWFPSRAPNICEQRVARQTNIVLEFGIPGLFKSPGGGFWVVCVYKRKKIFDTLTNNSRWI